MTPCEHPKAFLTRQINPCPQCGLKDGWFEIQEANLFQVFNAQGISRADPIPLRRLKLIKRVCSACMEPLERDCFEVAEK